MSELPWRPGTLRRAKPARPAKIPLTREQIVRAALRIVQAEGIDGVSMRRVAAEFETGPSSLYAHVTNKDELLQLMFDEMCGMVPVPEVEPGRWKEQISELARAGHRVMLEFNDLARAALATIPTGPNSMRISNAMLGMLLAGGVPPREAAWAMDRIFLYITADAYEHSIWLGEMPAAGSAKVTYVEALVAEVAAYFEQLPEDRYPHIRKYAREMTEGDPGERFEFGLAMLIDGLDKSVTEPR
jgi:AcrR family transcriptional regulator